VNAKHYYSKRLAKIYEYPFSELTKTHNFVLREATGPEAPKWSDHPSECPSNEYVAAVLTEANGLHHTGVKKIGSFPYSIPKDAPHTVKTAPDGQEIATCTPEYSTTWHRAKRRVTDPILDRVHLYPDDIEIRVYCGETELRAAVFSPTGEVSYLHGYPGLCKLRVPFLTKMYGNSAYLEAPVAAMEED
jgi:hypothetical protein